VASYPSAFEPHPYNYTSNTLDSLTLLNSDLNFNYSFSPNIPSVSYRKLALSYSLNIFPLILLYLNTFPHSPNPVSGSHAITCSTDHSSIGGLTTCFRARKWLAPASI